MRVDCDQDAVWIKVEQSRAGRLPHRAAVLLLPGGAAWQAGAVTLQFRDADKTFDSAKVYNK